MSPQVPAYQRYVAACMARGAQPVDMTRWARFTALSQAAQTQQFNR